MKKRIVRSGIRCVLGALLVVLAAGCEGWSSEEGPGGGGGGGIGSQGEGGGFLWKPVGENSGRLVVLLPPQYRGRDQGVFIANSSKNRIASGAYSGNANGGRPHYRFPEKGGAYGNNIYAVADLKDGSTVHWPIPSGSQRTTY